MATTEEIILEKTFYTYLNNKQILLDSKKDLMIKKSNDAISKDLNTLKTGGELRAVKPTDDRVLQVFFGGVNIAAFSRAEIEDAVRDIRVVLEVWENSRASVADQ